MLIDNERIADLVKTHGLTVKYYQASLCPCVAENRGHPDPTCDCLNGFRYASPLNVKILRTGMNANKALGEAGRVLEGSAFFTVPYLVTEDEIDYTPCEIYNRVGVGDVIVCPSERKMRDRDILVKGTRDKLRAFSVTEVLKVLSAQKEYVEDADFEVQGLGTDSVAINWLDPGVPDGLYYTVEFSGPINYVVWDAVASDRGSDDEMLPKRLMCRIRNYVDFESTSVDLLKQVGREG